MGSERGWIARVGWGWLVLLVFVPGFLGPATELGRVDDVYWMLNLMCASACALLLTRLDRPLDRTLWIWVVLAVFLAGYFIKTYVVASNLPYWQFDADFFYELRAVLTAKLVAAGFRWIALGFVAFCVVAWALPSVRVGPATLRRDERFGTRPAHLRALILATLTLALGIAAVRLALGIGIHGVEGSDASTRLPFRLGTLIVRTEEDLLPAVSLLCLWAAERAGKGRLAVAALGVGFVNALATSFVSTSKGALLFQFAGPVLLLSVLTGRLSRRRIVLLAGVGATMMVLFVLLSSVRNEQSAEGGSLGVRGIITLGSQVVSDRSFARDMQVVGQKFLMRVTGADGVWMCVNRPSTIGPDGGWAAVASRITLTEYYGRVVVGRRDPATFDSPGLLGACMLVGGWLGVLLLVPATIVLVWAAWWMLSQLSTRAVAQALGGVFLFGFLGEGTFRFESLVIFAATLVMCEWIFRSVLATARQPGQQSEETTGEPAGHP